MGAGARPDYTYPMSCATHARLASARAWLLVLPCIFGAAAPVAAQRANDSPAYARARRAGELVRRGELHLRAGDRASALGDFRQAVQIDPRSVGGFLGLADVYMASRRLGDAFEALRVGLARSGGSRPLRAKLAELHELAGDPREALSIYRRLTHEDADDAAMLQVHMRLAQELGAWSEALQSARRLAALARRNGGDPDIALQVRALELLARPLDPLCVEDRC